MNRMQFPIYNAEQEARLLEIYMQAHRKIPPALHRAAHLKDFIEFIDSDSDEEEIRHSQDLSRMYSNPLFLDVPDTVLTVGEVALRGEIRGWNFVDAEDNSEFRGATEHSFDAYRTDATAGLKLGKSLTEQNPSFTLRFTKHPVFKFDKGADSGFLYLCASWETGKPSWRTVDILGERKGRILSLGHEDIWMPGHYDIFRNQIDSFFS